MKHGTCSGYNRGCRCEPCKTARREYNAAWKARVREQGRKPETHGESGYTNWGCRCDICREAWMRSERRRRQSRTERVADAPHGTMTAYNAWNCRCEECKKALKEYRGTGYLAERNRHNAQVQAETLDQARNRYKQWTGPELEVAARADLSHKQVALMLGRTYASVRNIRQKLEYLPRLQNLAGLPAEGLDADA